MRRRFIIIPVLLIGIGAVGLELSRPLVGNASVPANQVNSTWSSGSLNMADANREMESSLSAAKVSKATNIITYSGDSVKIVAFGGAMDNNGSGPKEKFVIGNLVNPTIHIQKGAQVTLELVNQDTDMPHGMEISTAQPPYGFMTMMQGGIYPGAFIQPIPSAHHGEFLEATTTFKANEQGTFYYLCEYPGHASEGMYGKIIID